jgi:hypothetical protein
MAILHTPKLNYPYPDPDQNVDVPRDVKALAEAVEPTVFDGKVRRGRLRCTISGQPVPVSDWNVGNPVFYQMVFDTVSEDISDTDDICDLANNRLVIPKTGYWMLTGIQVINNVTTPNAFVITAVRVGGTPVVYTVAPVLNLANYIPGNRIWKCTAGSFITMWSATNVDGVTAINAGSPQAPSMEATFLGTGVE